MHVKFLVVSVEIYVLANELRSISLLYRQIDRTMNFAASWVAAILSRIIHQPLEFGCFCVWIGQELCCL